MSKLNQLIRGVSFLTNWSVYSELYVLLYSRVASHYQWFCFRRNTSRSPCFFSLSQKNFAISKYPKIYNLILKTVALATIREEMHTVALIMIQKELVSNSCGCVMAV